MFKVGDVIVHNNFRKEQYTISGIYPNRDSVLVEPFSDVIDVSTSYYIGTDNLYKNWDYTDAYYRKLKLEKICSKLGIV